MVKMTKRIQRALLCLLAALCLTACAANPPQEKLDQKLLAYFEGLGYACAFAPVDEARKVPIYRAEAWRSLMLDGREEVLVYFDESNRADYLAGRVAEDWGMSARFGLRYVLVYAGEDEGVRAALAAIPNE